MAETDNMEETDNRVKQVVVGQTQGTTLALRRTRGGGRKEESPTDTEQMTLTIFLASLREWGIRLTTSSMMGTMPSPGEELDKSHEVKVG